jgi:hypothetical protein
MLRTFILLGHSYLIFYFNTAQAVVQLMKEAVTLETRAPAIYLCYNEVTVTG